MMPSSASSTQSSARQAAVLRASRAQARRTVPLRGARFDGGTSGVIASDDEEYDDDVSVSDSDDRDESFEDSATEEDEGTEATDENADERSTEGEKKEDGEEKKEGDEEKEGDKKDGEKKEGGEDAEKKDADKKAPDEEAPSAGVPSTPESQAAELAAARAHARRQQGNQLPEAPSAQPRNEQGDRVAPSAATQERQAREQAAATRGESRNGRIAQARAKLQEAKEAYKEFGEKVDAMRNIGSLVRSRLDQFFLSSVFAFPAGTLLATALLHGRVLASVPGLSNTRFGMFRFTAKNIFEMLPNSKKMRPFTFTPTTGFLTAGIIDAGIVIALLINFIITFFPYIVLAAGAAFLLDPGIRELMLSLIGF